MSGLRVHIDEVIVELRSVPRKTIAVHPDGFRQANWPNYSHALLRFTSIKTKTQWVVDFGGGQYGICQPFWKWPEYLKSFVKLTTKVKASPFGATNALFDVLGRLEGNPGLAYGMVGEVAKVMDSAAASAEKAGSFTLSTLVSEPDENLFKERKTMLLGALHEAVRGCVQSRCFRGKIRAAKAYEARFPGRSSVACQEVSQRFYLKSPAVLEWPIPAARC